MARAKRARKNKIDYSEDRLLSIASAMLDDHDYLGALKMLNRNVSLGDYSAETHELYAEAYDDMELREKCINKWFEYLDACYQSYDCDYYDAYEGMAVAYMSLGRDDVSAFYYEKVLKETGAIDEEEREQLLKAFIGDEKNPLKIVYPPEKADYSDDISEAVSMMRAGDFDGAVEKLSVVEDCNPEYINARNYMAMSYILGGRYDDAETVCRSILEKDANNIQALTSLSAVESERGRKEESVAIARRLMKIKTEDPEDIYKIATVCCENDMHAEAYEVFCRLGYDMQYDFNMLYFKAIAAYNSGRREKAIDILKKLVTIYPDAVIARYNLKAMIKSLSMVGNMSFTYYYRLPSDVREQYYKLMVKYDRLPQRDIDGFAYMPELREAVEFCLDEADSRNDKNMLRGAAGCAIKAKFDDIVRKILLNAFLADDIKVGMLQRLCERNEDNNFGVVICNIYRSVDLYAVDIGRTKRKIFLTAYGDLVCRFALIDNEYSKSLAAACERLYGALAAQKKLNLCTDEETVVAAIFSSSDLEIAETFKGDVCAFFGANPELYKQIMENL